MTIHSKSSVMSANAATVSLWLEKDEAVLVDVRETSEFDQEHIPGALLHPLSVLDPDIFPTVPGKRLVLHCAIGKRSEAAGKMLLKQGHENIIHLAGGMKAWKEAGFETDAPFVPPQAEENDASAMVIATIEPAAPAPLPGHVLLEEFINPHGIGFSELARKIGVERNDIDEIIAGIRPVTAEMSLRLARYFCTDDDFWLNLQLKFDLKKASKALGNRIVNDVTPRLCA